MKKRIGIWFLFFFIISFFYRNSFHSYFEGDEWYYFSIFLPLTRHPLGLLETVIKSFTDSNSISGGGHVTPFYNAIWFLQNMFFGLNFKYYMVFSLLLHTSNTFFLYLLVKKITKNNVLSLLTGFIFAIACVHYEAITWVMAVVPTQVSLLFTLLGLTFFIMWSRGGVKINPTLFTSLGLFLAGIFTKETVIGVVLLAPILLLPRGKKTFLRGLIFSSFAMTLYLPIRFGIPHLVDKSTVQSLHIPVHTLIFYQILLVERMITEVFVSSNILLVVSRYVAENIFLKMPSSLVPLESLELFSQSIGADILLLALSPLFFVASFVVLQMTLQKKKYYEILLFSIVLIVTSAFPLLFVLNYAPWWIEGAFIDSRHLYLPSVGASILLSFGMFHAYSFLAKSPARVITITFFSIVCILWVCVQYTVIQTQAEKFRNLAVMRQILIKTMETSIPQLPEKAVILVESDTPYFGFGEIPPFQTNLGQVLALIYFEKNQLPSELFTKAKYMEKGILGEGVVSHKNRTFGYYLHKSALLMDLRLGKFSTKDIYGYLWVGRSNELLDKTNEIRELAKNYTSEVLSTEKWKKMEVAQGVYFSYPPESQPQEIEDKESEALRKYEIAIEGISPITIQLMSKSNKLPFHEFLQQEKKSEQIPPNAEYYIKNIFTSDGATITAVYVKSGDYARYFVPFGNGINYLELSTLADPGESDRDKKYINKKIELLLSTFSF